MDTLTEEQWTRLRTLVGNPAWTFYKGLPPAQQISEYNAFIEYGDLRIVAAEVLEAAAAGRSADPIALEPQVKRDKTAVLETEYFAAPTAQGMDASAWLSKAARLRAEVKAALRAGSAASGATSIVPVF